MYQLLKLYFSKWLCLCLLGDIGAHGVQGPQGSQGPQGDRGEPGVKGILTVVETYGAPGDPGQPGQFPAHWHLSKILFLYQLKKKHKKLHFFLPTA